MSERSGGRRDLYVAAASATIIVFLLAGYAVVNLVYNPSRLTVGVSEDPLVWEQGSDYQEAVSRGYASGFVRSANKTYMNVSVCGIPEATLVIDDLLHIRNQTSVQTFNVEISSAISGSLVSNDRIQTLKLRFWTGSVPPTTDNVPTLDLTAPQNTITSDIQPNSDDIVKVQLVAEFRSGTLASEQAQVSIRIVDIVE